MYESNFIKSKLLGALYKNYVDRIFYPLFHSAPLPSISICSLCMTPFHEMWRTLIVTLFSNIKNNFNSIFLNNREKEIIFNTSKSSYVSYLYCSVPSSNVKVFRTRPNVSCQNAAATEDWVVRVS